MGDPVHEWNKEKVHTFRKSIETLAENVKTVMELFNLDLKTILAFILMEVEEQMNVLDAITNLEGAIATIEIELATMKAAIDYLLKQYPELFEKQRTESPAITTDDRNPR